MFVLAADGTLLHLTCLNAGPPVLLLSGGPGCDLYLKPPLWTCRLRPEASFFLHVEQARVAVGHTGWIRLSPIWKLYGGR